MEHPAGRLNTHRRPHRVPPSGRVLQGKHLCASGLGNHLLQLSLSGHTEPCQCRQTSTYATGDTHTLDLVCPAESTLPHTTCTVHQHQQQTNVYVLGLRGSAPVEMQATPYTTSLTRATHLRARRPASKQATATTASETTQAWAPKGTQFDSAGAGNNHKLNTKKGCRWLVSDGAQECVNGSPP